LVVTPTAEDARKHFARWQGVKTISRLEEESDDGVTVIREKEQFSHCLHLLFIDGRTALLTANEPTEEPHTEAAAIPKENPGSSQPNGRCHVEEG
jgi:hypothetical protein